MTFAFLADHLEYRPLLAEWYAREWPDLFSADFTPEHELDSCLNHNGLNCTILALEEKRLVGAASLLAEDVLPLPTYSPWLGSVVVDPAQRRRGHGRQIVEAAMSQARALNVQTLHLWTPHHRDFYEKIGWEFARNYVDEFRSVAILRFHFF